MNPDAPRRLVRLAAALLPPPLRPWGDAMHGELANIPSPAAALRFALGCLAAALRSRINHTGNQMLRPLHDLAAHPRAMALACASAATGLGIFHMLLAGAPARYILVNLGALIIGALFAGMALIAAHGARRAGGLTLLALGAGLLAASLFGTSSEGATRWLMLGPQPLQPSLILLPVMTVAFAQLRTPLAACGVVLAAIALALQPDRAMAAALMAALAATALARPDRTVILALMASAAAFAATLVQPDTLGATPYVDQVFYTSFAVHPLAGLAVLLGAALLVLPAATSCVADRPNRAAYLAFGAVWFTIALAAALGNYPTPLVGYGGSAILGYLISLAAFPAKPQAAPANDPAAAAAPSPSGPLARTALSPA